MAGRRPTPRTRARHSGRPAADRRRVRLVRWYRVVPAVLLALTLLVVVVVAANPTSLGRYLVHPVRHVEAIEESCERHDVDPLLACAVIQCESGWDEGAVSSAGAIGLMQVTPVAAQTMVLQGIVDPDQWNPDELADAETNIEYGCATLGYLQNNLSSLDEVIAAYNAGIGAVQGWIDDGGSVPEDVEYAETRTYLERVRNAYEGYRKSYPDGITES